MVERKKRAEEYRWPWYQQVLDALLAGVGIGIAISMAYRNNYPIPGIALVALCAGKITTSGLLRLLLGRWESKP